MSFYGPIPELETVQEEEETRSDANAPSKRSKKRSFTILEQKEVIETSGPDYTPFITSIYRSFQLYYPYMASWKLVQLFLFLIQSVLNLLLNHTNKKAQTIEKSSNTLTMMELRQRIAIRIQMSQNLSKKPTIQSFWSLSNFYNSSLSPHRYQALKRYLNVEFSLQMLYNNASWFWKVEQALNVFRNQLFLFTVPGSHFAIDESAIKFHGLNRNKFQLRHKPAKEGFIIFALASNGSILHDFMLWGSRDGLEYNKKSTTVNISSRTTRERQKSTTEATAMKVHLSSTKEVVYTLCERVTRNLQHPQFICFIDNLFTDPHLARALLTLNVNICGIIRANAPGISQDLKVIAAAAKSQLNLGQWIHRVVDNVNCFVWRDAQRDHVVTFDTSVYTWQASELTPRKSRFTTGIPFRNDARRIIVEQFTIAVQYNLHMGHVDPANQLRANLTIFRLQQFKWIKRMIEYMIDSASINAYLVWSYYQSNKNFSHRDRRVFIQKFIKRLLQSSDIIHHSSVGIKSTYCVWSGCLINSHTGPRKRSKLSSISINIQHRHGRRTFNYCMKCKTSLYVFKECWISYHESKEVAYKLSDV